MNAWIERLNRTPDCLSCISHRYTDRSWRSICRLHHAASQALTHNAKEERNHNVATIIPYDIDISARFDLSEKCHLGYPCEIVDEKGISVNLKIHPSFSNPESRPEFSLLYCGCYPPSPKSVS